MSILYIDITYNKRYTLYLRFTHIFNDLFGLIHTHKQSTSEKLYPINSSRVETRQRHVSPFRSRQALRPIGIYHQIQYLAIAILPYNFPLVYAYGHIAYAPFAIRPIYVLQFQRSQRQMAATWCDVPLVASLNERRVVGASLLGAKIIFTLLQKFFHPSKKLLTLRRKTYSMT